VKGIVLHCGKYGCIIRLEDGTLANLPPADAAHGGVRRALSAKRRPEFAFDVSEEDGRLVLRLAPNAPDAHSEPAATGDDASLEPRSGLVADVSASTPLDQKIIEYLRQTADWDPNGAIANRAQETKQTRADRLLPFEARARRQYRDTPKKPPRKKR
jgi:hypothetical protein